MCYPSVYVWILSSLYTDQDIEEYRKFCKGLKEGPPERFGLYVFGYLMPWFEE